MGAVVLLAAGGITAYLVAMKPAASRHQASLPTKVVAVATVGLVASGPPGAGRTAGPQMLVRLPSGLAFSPVPRSRLVTGNPEWTADQMAGATYIFIYSATGQCLGSASAARAPRLTLQRCDLGASQRWRPLRSAVVIGGRSYRQYGNLGTGGCISVGTAGLSAAPGDVSAGLARCSRARTWRQLVSFWWGS
jgi:hypothetical protein